MGVSEAIMSEEQIEKMIKYCCNCKHYKMWDDGCEDCDKSWNVEYNEDQECFECPDFEDKPGYYEEMCEREDAELRRWEAKNK